jgi:hypothetical protein
VLAALGGIVPASAEPAIIAPAASAQHAALASAVSVRRHLMGCPLPSTKVAPRRHGEGRRNVFSVPPRLAPTMPAGPGTALTRH